MGKVILRQEAIDDLTDIWEYTSQIGQKHKPTSILGQLRLVVFAEF